MSLLTPGAKELPATSEAEPPVTKTPPTPEPEPVVATEPAEEDAVQRAQEQLIQLRQQQEAIERQKRELEALNKRQAEFEAAREEVTRNLTRAVVALEREQYDAEKIVEHLRASREKLEHQVHLVEGIEVGSWAKAEVSRELTRAESQVQDAQQELAKACVRINTERGEEVLPPAHGNRGGSPAEWRFVQWFKAGVAFTLPLFLLMAGAFALFFHFLFNILAGGR